MSDDLTLGELAWRLDHAVADLKDDLRSHGIRIDGKVGSEVLLLQQAAQDERHQALVARVQSAFQELDTLRRELARQAEDAMKREKAAEQKQQENRRWQIGTILVPVLVVLLPLLITRGKLL